MTLEIGLVVIGGHNIFIRGASSVEVEYSALVCNHNYSLCVIYWYSYLSRVYLPASKVSEEEEPQGNHFSTS